MTSVARALLLQRSPWPVLDAATVLALVALALCFARPQLEGWSLLVTFHNEGFFGALEYFRGGAPSRLLEPLPGGVAAFLPLSGPVAIGLVYAVIVAAKYLVARWAVSAAASGPTAWLLATVAAVMLPWSDHWRGHNLAQELAALFMIAAVGWALRLGDRPNPLCIVALIGFVFLSLVTYEALILCALAMPLLALAGSPRPLRAAAVCAATVLVALALFALFFYVAVGSTDRDYHGMLAQGDAYTDPLAVLGALYRTVYLDPPWMLPALVTVAVAVGASAGRRSFLALPLMVAGGLAVIPLFSLIYAVNFYFLSDPARAGLPAGFGFFLLCVLLAMIRKGPAIPGLVSAAVVILIGVAALNGYRAYQPYLLQRTLLDQVKAIARAHPASTYIVRDWTGRYGDMYTFLAPDTLRNALFAEEPTMQALLCTPLGVERTHPTLQRSGSVSPLDRCDRLTLPVTEPALSLDVRANAQGEPIVTLSAE